MIDKEPFVEKSLLICGIMFSGNSDYVDVIKKLEAKFGKVLLVSEEYSFDEISSYYAEEMGRGLKKKIIAFALGNIIDRLSEFKHFTNSIEKNSCQLDSSGKQKRTINLDPGYLTPSKLVLASTKGYSHRISIGKGIFAEVTLLYEKGKFVKLPWTYPDYMSDKVLHFLGQTRKLLLK